jgi:hypothetical protein
MTSSSSRLQGCFCFSRLSNIICTLHLLLTYVSLVRRGINHSLFTSAVALVHLMLDCSEK